MKSKLPKNDDWFEKPVLISGQMKVGGTLFSCMLDGSADFFVLPDLPEFRILFQKEYINNKQMAADWLLGFNNIFQGLQEPIFNFNPSNENIPVPIEYSNLPFSLFKLKGYLRGLDSWENCFSIDEYHKKLKFLLEQDIDSKKEVLRATVLATMAGCKDKGLTENPIRWGYRGVQSALTSIFTNVQLQDNEVDQFFKTFPKGQAIFQVRDPHAIVLSSHNHYKTIRSSFGNFHSWISFLNDCKIAHESLKQTIDFQFTYSDKKLMVIQYENLVENPKKVMTEISSFLKISYSKTLISPTIFGQSSKVITAFEIEGSKVENSPSKKWRTKMSAIKKLVVDAFIIENIAVYNRVWGYDTYYPKPLVWVFRICFLIPLLFMCQILGGQLLSAGRWLKNLVGLSYIEEKNRSNVELNVSASSDYDALYGGASFHFIQKELARIAAKNTLNDFKRILIMGTQRNLFALHFAKKAEQVHVVHPDGEFLKWLKKLASSHELGNITTFSHLKEDFNSEESYDLIFIQDNFNEGQINYDSKIKKSFNLMNDNSTLYITWPGLGNPLINFISNVYFKQCSNPGAMLKDLFRLIFPDQSSKVKSYRKSFYRRNEFRNLLRKNGLYIDRMGFVDTVLEGVLPAKVGPFIRKWEAVCKKVVVKRPNKTIPNDLPSNAKPN